MRPLVLDAYCKAGGSAKGYADADCDVVGVDIQPQPNFPYHFIRADAIAFIDEHGWEFDIIHAGPPCQANLTGLKAVNRKLGRDYAHADLLEATRQALIRSGKLYVLEQPKMGAKLINPVTYCGSSFGLPIRRHRQFESNVPLVAPVCDHSWQTERKYWTSFRPGKQHRRSVVVQVYGQGGEQHLWGPALGIGWMTPDELTQAIPPAYTEHIGRQLLAHLKARKAA